MTRNLKAFGLALVAMLAIGAIGAQAASAVVEHSFRSSAANEDTVLTGKSESYSSSQTSQHIFTATAGLTVECDATFVGRNIGNPLDTVAVRPTYTNCKDNATVTNTGCQYVFDSDTTQASGHSASSEHAAVSLDCEHQHYIEVTKPGCKLRFEDTHTGVQGTVNQSIHGVRYTQLSSHSGKHALTVKATAKTITYTVLAGSFCGLAGHGAGTYHNGTYDGTAEVTGFEFSTKTGGSSLTTGTTYSHSAQVDITLSTPT
jgi:hypothetical protein